jgi:hypothetical protein
MLKQITLKPHEIDMLLPLVGLSAVDVADDDGATRFFNRVIEKFNLTDDPLAVIEGALGECRGAMLRPYRMQLALLAAHDRTGATSELLAPGAPEMESGFIIRMLFVATISRRRSVIASQAAHRDIHAAVAA